jgi:hypothetical protein
VATHPLQRLELRSNWYGRVGGRPVALCSNKSASEIMLGDLCRDAANRTAGIGDPYEVHNKKPLASLLEDYRRELLARNNEPRYVRLVVARLSALLEGCGVRFIPELSLSSVTDRLATRRRDERLEIGLPAGQEQFTRGEAAALLGMSPTAFRDTVKRHRLKATGKGSARRYQRETVGVVHDLQGRGASVQTTNYYVSHLKSFCRWLVKDRRVAESPAEHVESVDAEADRRRARRELTAEEFRRLLTPARGSGRAFRGLSGEDRYHL